MSWLDDLMDMHSDMETPTSFWLWSGLVTISAVLKDSVWLNRGGKYDLYPNIYCILHGDSGIKKGPPIALSNRLVRAVNNIKIIEGRSSIQAILKELGTAQTAPGGKISSKAAGYINASELSSALIADPAAMDILTDLYDRHYRSGPWTSLLKMEVFTLKNPTVILFGGINDAHAANFFEMKDLQGGFFARTFIVYEKEEARFNSLVRRGPSVDDDKLIKYLKILNQLSGPFKDLVDEHNNPTEVGEYYDQWYLRFRTTVKASSVKDETGTLKRFGDSILKIAMLLSVAEEPKLEISLNALQRAINIGEKLIGGVRQAMAKRTGNTESGNAARKTILIQELMKRPNHAISKKQLHGTYWMHGNVDEWDACVISLHEAGLVTVGNLGSEVIYQMPEKVFKDMEEFLKGKKI